MINVLHSGSWLGNVYQLKEVRETEEFKRVNRLIDLGINRNDIINIDNKDVTIKYKSCKNIYNVTTRFIYYRIKVSKINPCTNCIPVNISSGKELELLDFIKSNYDGEIIENDRKVLSGKELDIYLPGLNLAFEFNGLYWHSELHKDDKYHLEKTEKCLDKGV